jgi:hypothetical protein
MSRIVRLKKIGKFSSIKIFACLLNLIIMWAYIANADSIKFDATVDQNKVTVDDSFTLTLTLASDSGVNEEEPTLPDLSNFEVLNKWNQSESSSVFVNGKFQFLRRQIYKYTLQPQKQGVLTLGPAEVVVKGQTLKSTPIKITVLASGAMPSGPPANSNVARNRGGPGRRSQGGQQAQPNDDDQSANPFAGLDDDDDFAQLLRQRGLLPNGRGGIKSQPMNDRDAFIVAVEANKSKVFVGEEIVASWYIYTRGSIQSFDALKYPDLKGFWKEDLEQATRLNMQSAVVNGIPYNKALLVSYALFPIGPGKKTIDSYKAKATIIEMNSAMSVFGIGHPYAYTKVSKELPIEVLPLPTAGKPDSFSGAVGNFHITGNLNTAQIKANQPFSLKIRFQGVGNVKAIELPPLNLPKELEVYDTKKESQFMKTGEGFKEFEILLIPRAVGDMKIPPIAVSYFDPKAIKYVSQSTPTFQIKVLPGDGSAPGAPNVPLASGGGEVAAPATVAKDIKYLKTSPTFDVSPPVKKAVWGIIFFILIAGFGVAFIRLWKFDPSDLTDAVKRRVGEKMKVARAKLKTGDTRGVGVECSNALLATLGEVTRSGGVSLTAPELLKRLAGNAEKNDQNKTKITNLQSEIQKFLSLCELVSFAPAELSKSQSEIKDLDSLVRQAERLIEQLFNL